MKLVWFRNDLRIKANRPLSDALATGEPVMAVFCLCREQWQAHGVAPLRQWYVLESVKELGRNLAQRGIDLHVLPTADFQDVPESLAALVREYGITALYCNRDYPLNERQRDQVVADQLRPLGVTLHGYDDGVLVPPRQLRTGKGTPYTVYSPYKRRWDRWLDEHPPAAVAEPAWPGGQGRFHGQEAVEKALQAVSVPSSLTALWRPGEAAASEQLNDFVANHLADYQKNRDFPDLSATSGLSTALSAGTLSPLSCYLAAHHAMADAGARAGAACWIGELAWRDFYRQIMAHFPRLARGGAFRRETELLHWRQDEEGFQRWCEGRTGYPLVDAAMRQLVETGWMHNRLRMVTAMFLSKHLFIDWRRGEAFFMAHLIDGDFAANNGGWQWSASSGTDAVPYFRVFNPVRQSQRFDAQGRFIARFVPELAHLDSKSIHQPWQQPLLAAEYPPPCVPHQGVREAVTDAFKTAKQQYDATNRNTP